MRYIVYVDGAVGVGKSTFIKILERTFASVLMIWDKPNKSYHFNVEVLPEPLHRDWTSRIVNELGYSNLLKFLLVRKVTAIETWSSAIASNGLQELEHNVLIVERSPEGDRLVSEGYVDEYPELNVRYTGESVHKVFIKDEKSENEEQTRLNVLYNDLEIEQGTRAIYRLQRPRYVSTYYAEAAAIVKKVLGL